MLIPIYLFKIKILVMSNLFNSSTTTDIKPPRRILIWLIPLLLILIMAGLLLASGWKSLLPSKEVDVARARVGEASVAAKEGETLFQAAGWVQADPFSVRVTALVSGIVKKVHVIEGQKVQKGQLLVELIDDDLKLQLQNEKDKLQELILAKKEKELWVKNKKARLEQVNCHEDTAKAAAERIKHKMNSYKNAKGALPEFQVEQSRLEYEEQLKKVTEFISARNILKSEIELAVNAVKVAEAKIKTQKTVIDKAELDLSRTKIHASTSGILDHVHAMDGRKQMLGSDNDKSTTVASIFDTKKIQVLVDVPLVDVPKVKIGQKTEIHTEVLDKPLEGVVTLLSGQADYQKNTLQVKVAIPGGHPDLRPDMIAQVKFLSDAPEPAQTEEKVSGVFIKKESITDSNEAWVVNSKMQVVKKSVSLGKNESDGWVQVISGINAGEKVIISPGSDIQEGATVKVGKVYE